MQCTFLDSICDIDATEWNTVAGTDYPFCRHEFLYALEKSNSCNRETGWLPQHLVIRKDDIVIALMPLYLKDHSYGEYVFDWSWASAYERSGINYYPKLLSAIPYTPATGPRLLIASKQNREKITALVANVFHQICNDNQLSSAHILLSNKEQTLAFAKEGFKSRASVQYHWFNANYASFDDFLKSFSSRKRKNLRKERQKVIDQGVSLKSFTGDDITDVMWDKFYHFYQMTYSKRSGHGGYLQREFFEILSNKIPEQILLVLASHNDEYIAGALYFIGSDTLYGRYWGCSEEYEMLHFETCYYQGIDYCIRNNLKKFDPGAQGEHKIQRGFIPIHTHSLHHIAHPQFSQAIDNFIEEEKENLSEYRDQACAMLPFNAEFLERGPLSHIIENGSPD